MPSFLALLWYAVPLVLSLVALSLRDALRTIEYDLEDALYERDMEDARIRRQRLVKDIEGARRDVAARVEAHGKWITEYASRSIEHDALDARRIELDRAIVDLENDVDDARIEKEKYMAMVDGYDGMAEYTRGRESALWGRIHHLQDKIGRESHREALEW